MNDERDLWIPNDKPVWPKILLRSALVIAVIVIAIVLISKRSHSEDEASAQGIQRIKDLEGENVAAAETYIQGIREQWTEEEAAEIAEQATALKNKFVDTSTLIMGDSLTKGLIDYGVLDSSVIIASSGASTGDCGNDLEKALKIGPWNIVLSYGIDDIVNFDGDKTEFIKGYEYMVDVFKEMRPNAVIYICQIPPVSSEVLLANPVYEKIDEYNAAIRQLCTDKKLVYIETSDLVTDYSGDGILPNYDFFTNWVNRILSSVFANLNTDVVKIDPEAYQ